MKRLCAALLALAGICVASILQKVNGDIAKTMSRPDIQQRMRQDGMVTDPLSPEQLRQLIVRESTVSGPSSRRPA